MTTYFVRVLGDDTASGLDAAHAWRSLSHALGVLQPGDTLYIGAGLYAGGQTLAVSGHAAAPITLIGDVRGEQTGDAGIVLWTTYDDLPLLPNAAVPAATVLTLDGTAYVTLRGLTLIGAGQTEGPGVLHIRAASVVEVIVVEDCYIGDAGSRAAASALTVAYTAPTVAPSGEGLRVDRCLLVGQVVITQNENDAAAVDLKALLRNTLILSRSGALVVQRGDTSVYSANGVQLVHCTLLGAGDGTAVVATVDNNNGVTPITLLNCLFVGGDLPAAGQVRSLGGNVVSGSSLQGPGLLDHATDLWSSHPKLALGGLVDQLDYKHYGQSTTPVWGPAAFSGYSDFVAGHGLEGGTAVDLYGRPRGCNGTVLCEPATVLANNGWTDPQTINDGRDDTVSFTGPIGGSYKLTLGGVRVLGGQRGVPKGLSLRLEGAGGAGTVIGGEVWTAGQGQRVTTFSLPLATATRYTADVVLPEPGQAWDWELIKGLEISLWRAAGSEAAWLTRVNLAATVRHGVAAGAVEARVRPATGYDPEDAGYTTIGLVQFEGAGYYELLRPVDATLSEVVVFCKVFAAYDGDPPLLEVEYPGGYISALWRGEGKEEYSPLVCRFTPTQAGLARIRVSSRDRSQDGLVYFDDLTVRSELPEGGPLALPQPLLAQGTLAQESAEPSSPLPAGRVRAPAPAPAQAPQETLVLQWPAVRALRGQETARLSLALPAGTYQLRLQVQGEADFHGSGPAFTLQAGADEVRYALARLPHSWTTLRLPPLTLAQPETLQIQLQARGADAAQTTWTGRWQIVRIGA